MRTKKWILIIYILISGSCFSQNLTRGELRKLRGTLFTNLSINDSLADPKRVAEFFECYLKVDGNGKVSGVNILSDNQNKGKVYALANRMTIATFKDWKLAFCKNKTIIIPIMILSNGNYPDYISDLKEYYVDEDDKFNLLYIVKETSSLIFLNTFLMGPVTLKE